MKKELFKVMEKIEELKHIKSLFGIDEEEQRKLDALEVKKMHLYNEWKSF